MSLDSKKFLSPDGFNPKIWGPSMWFVMTIIAANFPLRPTPQESLAYYNFYTNLKSVLPCASCRNEYTKMITAHEIRALRLNLRNFIQMKNERPGAARKRVFTWVVRVHAAVNKRKRRRRRVSPDFWAGVYSKLRNLPTRQYPVTEHRIHPGTY